MPLAFNPKSTNIPLKFVPPEQYVSTLKIKVGTTPFVDKNKKPKLISYADKMPKVNPKELAQMLFNQISGPSLNKNTIALLDMITKDNVAEVITEYQKLSKNNSLMKDIDKEWGLNVNIINEKLGKKLLSQAKFLGINIEGMRNLDSINDITEINEMLNMLTKKVKTCQDTINKAEKLRKYNSLEVLKKQYPETKYIIDKTEDKDGSKQYCIISKKNYSIVKTVLRKADYICVSYYKDDKRIKSDIATRKEPHMMFTMNSTVYYKYDKTGCLRSDISYGYNEQNGTICNRWEHDNIDDTDNIENYNNTLSLLDTKFYSVYNNQVKNKNYTGDKFDIKFNGYKATIINKTKNQTFKLDVSKILDNKYIKNKDKQAFLREIKTLPGEVLADLAIECNLIGNRSEMGKEFDEKELKSHGESRWQGVNSSGFAYAFYSAMIAEPNRDTITHELGHLIQFCGKDRYLDVSDGTWEGDFRETFELELPNYLKYLSTHKDSYRHYCSENQNEFFAETYVYLMLGATSHGKDDVIQKFFPKSYKMVKDRIAEIRKMPTKERNADIENRQKDKKETPTDIFSKIKNSIDSYFSRLTYGSDDYDPNIKNKFYKHELYKLIDNIY